MTPDAQLQSIDFKSNSEGLISVKVGLSNGLSSPEYEGTECEGKSSDYADNEYSVNFEQNVPARSVIAAILKGDDHWYDSYGYFDSIRFNDSEGSSIDGDYLKPSLEYLSETKISLDENEELIGVYGHA